MSYLKVFINRRNGRKRRLEDDPCEHMALDLFHRKRRKSTERRSLNRTLEEDYFAYLEARTPHPPELDASEAICPSSDDQVRR